MNWFTTETGGCGEYSPQLCRWRDVRIPFIYVRELEQGKQVPQEKQPTHTWNARPQVPTAEASLHCHRNVRD